MTQFKSTTAKYRSPAVQSPDIQVETLEDYELIFRNLVHSEIVQHLADVRKQTPITGPFNLEAIPDTLAGQVFKQTIDETLALSPERFKVLRDTFLGASQADLSSASMYLPLYQAIANARDDFLLQSQTPQNIDELTQLPDRSGLEKLFPEVREEIKNNSANGLLLYIDLDHFKIINDTHGHDAGDQVLKHVAERLKAHTRRGIDSVFRIGGDEFIILLVEKARNGDPERTPLDIIARKLQASLDSEPITFLTRDGTKKEAHVGFSMGIAPITPTSALSDLKIEADQAMYNDKGSRKYAPRQIYAKQPCALLKPAYP